MQRVFSLSLCVSVLKSSLSLFCVFVSELKS